MHPNIRWIAAGALSVAVLLAGCRGGDEAASTPPPAAPAPAPAPTPPPEPAPAPMPASASVLGVTLGNAVGTDMRIATPATRFGPKDTIHAAVATTTSDPMASVNGTLAAKWTFEDGQVVNEESREVVFTGDGSTVFQISKPDGWPVGRYRVEISLNGAIAQSADFEVQ